MESVDLKVFGKSNSSAGSPAQGRYPRKIPRTPAEPHRARLDPAEPSERPPQSPLRGKFSSESLASVVPRMVTLQNFKRKNGRSQMVTSKEIPKARIGGQGTMGPKMTRHTFLIFGKLISSIAQDICCTGFSGRISLNTSRAPPQGTSCERANYTQKFFRIVQLHAHLLQKRLFPNGLQCTSYSGGIDYGLQIQV